MVGVSRAAAPLPTYTEYRYLCLGIGDSLTYNGSYITLADYYPAVLQVSLRADGRLVTFVNYGVSGNTTGQILQRARALPRPPLDSLAVLYGGTNDYNSGVISTVQASPSPTTTAFGVETGKGTAYKIGTSVLVNGVSRTVASVSGDTVTVTPALSGAPSAGDSVKIDTSQNLIDAGGVLYGKGYTKLVIGKHHFLNFSSGGDTLAAQQTIASQTRTAQETAFTSLSASYGAVQADFYSFMRARIVAGLDVEGDHAWHVAATDVHLNEYGEGLLADCIEAAIPAAWLTALSR